MTCGLEEVAGLFVVVLVVGGLIGCSLVSAVVVVAAAGGLVEDGCPSGCFPAFSARCFSCKALRSALVNCGFLGGITKLGGGAFFSFFGCSCSVIMSMGYQRNSGSPQLCSLDLEYTGSLIGFRSGSNRLHRTVVNDKKDVGRWRGCQVDGCTNERIKDGRRLSTNWITWYLIQ